MNIYNQDSCFYPVEIKPFPSGKQVANKNGKLKTSNLP